MKEFLGFIGFVLIVALVTIVIIVGGCSLTDYVIGKVDHSDVIALLGFGLLSGIGISGKISIKLGLI